MDRNTFTGLALMFALLLGYQWYIAPTEEEIATWEAQQAQTQAQEDSLAAQATLDAEAAANALTVLSAISPPERITAMTNISEKTI